MKRKVRIKFLNDKTKEFQVNVRDKELLEINNLNHSHIYKNRKKYNRKDKHKNSIIE